MKPLAKRLLAIAGTAAIAMSTISSVHAVYREDTSNSCDEAWSAQAISEHGSLPVWAQDPSRSDVTDPARQRTIPSQEESSAFSLSRSASQDFGAADALTDQCPTLDPAVLHMDQVGLIPETVKSRSVTDTITRQELCQTAISCYKLLTGMTDEDLGEPDQMFLDTCDTDVLNAYHLDIIGGRGAGTFDPDVPMSRQDFFTLCTNFLRSLDYCYIDEIYCDLSDFSDSDQLAAYAVHPAKVVVAIGAVQADENGALNPQRDVTSQEALVIFSRILDFYADWSENPVEPDPYAGELVAEFALQFEGCRYVSGRRGPSKFDCSGLVYYVYQNFGYDLQPCAQNQWRNLDREVERSELLPGDLLFFSRNGRASGIFHVGIYIGDGEFIHAANSRKGVIITGLDEDWYARRYLGAKRAID